MWNDDEIISQAVVELNFFIKSTIKFIFENVFGQICALGDVFDERTHALRSICAILYIIMSYNSSLSTHSEMQYAHFSFTRCRRLGSSLIFKNWRWHQA